VRLLLRGVAFAIWSAILVYSASALAGDVPGMTCSDVGSFAREVAEQKAKGVTLNNAVLTLRQSIRLEYLGTERALEKIIRAIYDVETFSNATPKEVGAAYQRVCEMGQ
jgi:hypothetical protein